MTISTGAPTGASISRPLRFPLWRLCEILAVASANIFVQLPHLVLALLRRDPELRHSALGKAAARSAEQLGPVFTKAMQMISYRHDLLPAAFLEPLSKLQDRVRPTKAGDARRVVEASLGRAVTDLFTAFDDDPVACGSIAVVCRATGHDDKPIAVKIVRPGVTRQISRDLNCLRWFFAFAARSRAGRGVPIVETFDIIADMIANQGDMRAESRNLSQLREMLLTESDVRMPGAGPYSATADVLVMEFVGEAVAWTRASVSDAGFQRAANDLLVGLYNMIFKLGVVHCDLHPGNILLQPDGAVVLIDAGLVAHLSELDRRCFRDLFLALALNNSSGCAASIFESALAVPADFDRPAFENDVRALVRTFHGRRAGDFLVADFVFRIFALQRHHRLFGPPGFAGAIWALAMFEGLVRARHPELDFQAVARPFVTTALIAKRA